MAETGKVISLFRAMHSILQSRAKLGTLAGTTYEGARDSYAFLGYKRELAYEDYQARYDRGGIASRLVDAYPHNTWRLRPKLVDEGKQVTDRQSRFVTSFNTMAKRLGLYHYFERADRLAGIGEYSVLLIGVRGGRDLASPIQKLNSPDDVLYVTPYSQANAQILEYEGDPASPRFGLPKFYQLRMAKDLNVSAGSGGFALEKRVHYSRILHIAEGLLEDEMFGRPRLKPVWNYLDDLEKIIGGSSEAVWRTADRGIQFDIDKELDMTDADEDAFADEIEDYMHNLQRYIRTRGVKANVLGSDVADIQPHFEAVVALISGTSGIPSRILLGSERGQLASTSDERNFSSRVKERQTSFAEPIMIRPLVNRLTEAGAFKPTDYRVDWPDVVTLSDREKADVAARYGQAIKNVSSQGPVEVINGEEFRKRFIDD